MSWRVVAKRDVLDPYRSQSLWILLGVYVLAFGAIAHFVAGPETPLASSLVGVARVFVPLTALALGYQSIAGSRQNGSLRVVLAYPHSRREVVLGRAVGRSVVTVLAVTVGFLAAAIVFTVETSVPALGPLAVAWAATLLLGVSMASLAVGVSASVRTVNRAVMLCFGGFLVFLAFWRQLPNLLRYLLAGFRMPRGPPPEWVAVFNRLEPMTAYQAVIRDLLPGRRPPVTEFHATEWFGVLVLLGWLLLPLVVGVWQFDRQDL